MTIITGFRTASTMTNIRLVDAALRDRLPAIFARSPNRIHFEGLLSLELSPAQRRGAAVRQVELRRRTPSP